jgi:phosphoenolpyruvate carboxylase
MPVTAEDVETARKEYVSRLGHARDVLDPSTQIGKTHLKHPEMPEHYRRVAEVFRFQLEEVQGRYEAQERAAERTKAQELTEKQVTAANAQATAAGDAVSIAKSARTAAWAAAIAALVYTVVACVQTFGSHHQ